jgi:hypothetical protein
VLRLPSLHSSILNSFCDLIFGLRVYMEKTFSPNIRALDSMNLNVVSNVNLYPGNISYIDIKLREPG